MLIVEQELRIFDRRERPDYETLQAVIDYFEEYPARCHHPKEDIIVAILKKRNPAAVRNLGNLEADHRDEAERLLQFARTIENVRTGRDMPRQTVAEAVRDFIDHERRHIELEERVLFPAAMRALRPVDRAHIDARMSDERDPLFTGMIEQKFRSLAQKILRWEQENESDRLKSLASAKP